MSKSNNSAISILVVDKQGTLKEINVKKDKNKDKDKEEFPMEEMYKKCGFKKPDGFVRQHEWKVKVEGGCYFVSVYAKEEGRANGENKYDFPPPIDKKLFFGSCGIVAMKQGENGQKIICSLTPALWDKIYEKLFGGFEDLKVTGTEDEEEEDELANVPGNKKTKKGGYLKDGFVVDSDSADDDGEDSYDTDDEDELEDQDEDDEEEDKLLEQELGSELSEETYDYSSEEKSDK